LASDTPRPDVLLLSSNLRRRYSEDVLTALALMEGALIQFRYGMDYVAPALQQRVANRSVIGERALIAFIADVDSNDPFLVPVRFARIADAECVADMFVFKLSAEAYASIDDYPFSEHDIRESSRTFIAKLTESNGRYYPATNKFPGIQVNNIRDRAQLWLGIARRLAKHQTFQNCYFLRLDEPITHGNKLLTFDVDGRLALSEQQSVRLRVSFFSEGYSEQGKKSLNCLTDGTFLRVSSEESCDVALRYDSVEFWLQPASTNFDALARVTIQLVSTVDDSAPTTTVRFPVLVRRSKGRLALRLATSAIGAFLVALPAIFGQGSPLRIRILSSVFGAILLSYSTIIMPRSRDPR
jgi:hypothetical protein